MLIAYDTCNNTQAPGNSCTLVQHSVTLRILSALSRYIPSWRWKSPWSSASILWRTSTWWVIRCSLRDMRFAGRRCWAKTVGWGDLSPRRPGFVPKSVYLKFLVDKLVLENVYLRIILLSPCQYHSNSAPYSFSYTYWSYYKVKRTKLTSVGNSNVLSETGERWTEKYFHCRGKTKKPY